MAGDSITRDIKKLCLGIASDVIGNNALKISRENFLETRGKSFLELWVTTFLPD